MVVNKWGSWCAPCRAEFPALQRQSVEQGKRVAFLGVDGQDNDDNARKFLEKYPVAYPSYVDGDLSIAQLLRRRPGLPVHRLLRPQGRDRVHQAGQLPQRGRPGPGHPPLRPLSPPIAVRAPRDEAELQRALDLRHEVFCVEQGVDR